MNESQRDHPQHLKRLHFAKTQSKSDMPSICHVAVAVQRAVFFWLEIELLPVPVDAIRAFFDRVRI